MGLVETENYSDLEQNIQTVFSWCRQAENRGIFQGDLCRAQILGKDIAEIVLIRMESRRWRDLHKHIDALFETWLKIEHEKVYDEFIRRKEQEQEEKQFVNLKAESMSDLVQSLMHMSAMELDADGS